MDFIPVCNKGDMLLEINKNTREYRLKYEILDLKNLNIKEFISFKIYNLIKTLNPELIDDIQIIKIYNDYEIDIFFKLKNIGKELGDKQKCMILKIIKNVQNIDENNMKVVFNSKSIDINNTDVEFFKNIDLNEYSILNCEFSNNYINIHDRNISIESRFLIKIEETIPLYMENFIGLMMKKIFFNVKKFIDKIEETE